MEEEEDWDETEMINIKPIKPANRKIQEYIKSITEDEKESALEDAQDFEGAIEWKSGKLKTYEEIQKHRKKHFYKLIQENQTYNKDLEAGTFLTKLEKYKENMIKWEEKEKTIDENRKREMGQENNP
jgi:hypothetical protein